MGIFNKLFTTRSGEDKEQFLAGWEVILDGGEHYQSFAQTQNVDRATAERLGTYIHLIFGSNNLLKEVRAFFDGNEEEGSQIEGLREAIGKLPYQQRPVNQIYDLIEMPLGVHQLGGDVPEGFRIPSNTCPGSYQYIGRISPKDNVFSWLPFELNMICPIYLDIDKVWVDYTQPDAPIVLNAEHINKMGTAYDDLKNDSEIIFEQHNFNTVPAKEYGVAGVPNWIQYPAIPRCPRTNKTMRLLCQLPSNIGIMTKRTNVVPRIESYKSYFEEMNFWGDGDLFVFFEPESRIACYFIQNT